MYEINIHNFLFTVDVDEDRFHIKGDNSEKNLILSDIFNITAETIDTQAYLVIHTLQKSNSWFFKGRKYIDIRYKLTTLIDVKIEYLINLMHHIIQHKAIEITNQNHIKKLNKIRWFILINPGSGAKHSVETFVNSIKPILDVSHVVYDTFVSEGPGLTYEFGKTFNKEYDLVAFVSGDGLIYEFMNGYYSTHTEFTLPFVSLFAGSGCCICSTVLLKHNESLELFSSLRIALVGKLQKLDLLSVETTNLPTHDISSNEINTDTIYPRTDSNTNNTNITNNTNNNNESTNAIVISSSASTRAVIPSNHTNDIINVDPKYYWKMEHGISLPRLSYALTEIYLGLAADVISSAEWMRCLSGFRFIPSAVYQILKSSKYDCCISYLPYDNTSPIPAIDQPVTDEWTTYEEPMMGIIASIHGSFNGQMGLDRELYLNDHYIALGIIINPSRFNTLIALSKVLDLHNRFEDFQDIPGVIGVKARAIRINPKGTPVCIDGENRISDTPIQLVVHNDKLTSLSL